MGWAEVGMSKLPRRPSSANLTILQIVGRHTGRSPAGAMPHIGGESSAVPKDKRETTLACTIRLASLLGVNPKGVLQSPIRTATAVSLC
jgi:hypothetical protein